MSVAALGIHFNIKEEPIWNSKMQLWMILM